MIREPLEDTPAELVNTRAGLRQVVDECISAPWVSFDIESNGFYCFRERTCILTVSIPAGHFIIDSLALWDDMSIFCPVFARDDSELYVHGGSYDVTSLKRDYGCTFPLLRDTHVAANLLGREGVGLASLVNEAFGVELPKELQKHDWSRRPLQPKQLAYLTGDTRFLPALSDRLDVEIRERDIAEEYLIECEVIANLPPATIPKPDPEGFRRMRNLRALSDEERSVLSAVCHVRDQMACENDIAPFRVAGNEVLLNIATGGSNGELPQQLFNSVNRSLRREFMERAQYEAREALKRPPPAERPSSDSNGPRLTRAEIERRRAAERRIKGWRKNEANSRGIGPQAVLPTPILEELVRRSDITIEDLAQMPRLGPRRLDRYGAILVALAANRGR